MGTGLYDDLINKNASTAPTPSGQSEQAAPSSGLYDDLIKSDTPSEPGLIDRAISAVKAFGPQGDESVADAAIRDVKGLAEGIAKPFATLGAEAAYQMTDPLRTGMVGQLPFARPSPQDVLTSVPAAAATVLAGPVAGRLATSLGGSVVARIVSGAVTDAAAGAAFNPSDPGVGALLGGTIGAATHIRGGMADLNYNGVRKALVDEGGYTIDPRTGQAFKPDGGYQVGGISKPLVKSLDDLTASDIQQAHMSHKETMLSNDNAYMGGWVDNGQAYIEPSEHVASLEEAVRTGQQRGEKAIWDWKNNRSIDISDPKVEVASLHPESDPLVARSVAEVPASAVTTPDARTSANIETDSPATHETEANDLAARKGVRPGVQMDEATTGTPFEQDLYRGTDSRFGARAPLASRIFGNAETSVPERGNAVLYGPNITAGKVRLENPLVIDSDQAWKALTDEAGWASPLSIGESEKTNATNFANLRKVVDSKGYDGVVVRIPKEEVVSGGVSSLQPGANGQLLDRLFHFDQAIRLTGEKAAAEGASKLPAVRMTPGTPTPPRYTFGAGGGDDFGTEIPGAGGGGAGSPPNQPPAGIGAGPDPFNPGNIDPNDFINLGKIDVSDPLAKKVLAQEVIRMVNERGLSPKERVTWQDTLNAAKNLGVSPRDLANGAGTMSRPEFVAAELIVRRNGAALGGLMREYVQRGTNSPELKMQIDLLDAQNDALFARLTGSRSEIARSLNIMKMQANQTTDPLTWLYRADKAIGPDRQLTEEQRLNIYKLANQAENTLPGSQQRLMLPAYVATLQKASPLEKMIGLWRAGLLTNPATLFRNILGHTAFATLEVAKDAPASAMDMLLGTLTGIRTKNYAPGTDFMLRIKGVLRGQEEARQLLTHGSVADELGNIDVGRPVHYENVILDRYVNTVYRAMAYEPRIIRAQALHASLGEQARVQATAELFKGDAWNQRVRFLMENPTDIMAKNATHDAEIAALAAPNGLSAAAASIQRLGDGAGAIVIPFGRTPANIITRALEYTPLGAASKIPAITRLLFNKSIQGAEKAALQKQIVDVVGRSATGTGPILAGFLLARSGRFTGPMAPTPDARETQRTIGQQPNAIKIGNDWLSVATVAPVSVLMETGAAIYRAAVDTEIDKVTAAARIGKDVGNAVVQHSMLAGLSSLHDALNDPEHFAARYVQGLAGSLIPNTVNSAAKGIDTTDRQVNSVGDAIMARIPGLSQMLPPRIDNLGRPETHIGGLEPLLDPFHTTVEKQSPLDQALAANGTSISGFKKIQGESDKEFEDRKIATGVATRLYLENIVKSDAYISGMNDLSKDLVADHPEYFGNDPDTLAKALQAGMLHQFVGKAHSLISQSIGNVRFKGLLGKVQKPTAADPAQVQAVMEQMLQQSEDSEDDADNR